MSKRVNLWLLKLIGVALFLLILSRIDLASMKNQIRTADAGLIALSFPVIFLIYFCKTQRFKALVHTTGITLPLIEHWKIFNIGVFLAGITPAKLGELGRAAYLKNVGIQMPMAIAISIADRLFDVFCIALIGIGSVGILFGWQWSISLLVITIIGLQVGWIFWKKLQCIQWISGAILPAILWTMMSWSMYFLWALLIAASLQINVSIPVMISVFTITGIVSLLPIAPSGLGTRDAALLLLLTPYGVTVEQAVSLAFLMFISMMMSSTLGGYYLLTQPKTLHPQQSDSKVSILNQSS